MSLKDNLIELREKMMKIQSFKNDYLYRKYRNNIYDINLTDSIKSGITDKLINARELGVPFCVVFGGVVPAGNWDPYGDGKWNPKRDYITTEDIADENNDREKERQNVYSFLRGEEIKKEKSPHK